jgi:hypothetical protein
MHLIRERQGFVHVLSVRADRLRILSITIARPWML